MNTATTPTRGDLERAASSGAGWLYWIGGLSMLNTLIFVFGGDMWLVVGLSSTLFLASLLSFLFAGAGAATAGSIAAVLSSVLFLGIFGLFGFFAKQRRATWAIVAGMVLYAADAVLTAAFQDWVGVLFHAFVLFMLFKGFQAMRALEGMPEETAYGEAPHYAQAPAVPGAPASGAATPPVPPGAPGAPVSPATDPAFESAQPPTPPASQPGSVPLPPGSFD